MWNELTDKAFKHGKMEGLIMGLFDRFSSDKKSPIMNDILSIPYDYSGYDLVFEEGTTDPSVYSEINALITNNNMDMAGVEGFNALSKETAEDEFWEFYDAWIEVLEQKGFVTELTMSDDINTFVSDINRILGNIGAPRLLNDDETVNAYRTEVVKYSFHGEPVGEDFKYDILEANIVAAELRKIGYELIAFFNSMDNNVKAVIPMDKISLMQEMEAKIK